jgi:hypothetical protein
MGAQHQAMEEDGAESALSHIVQAAVADAYARGEAHGRWMERHEAQMRVTLAAIERADAIRALLATGEQA